MLGGMVTPTALNLGCGLRKRPECLNVDVVESVTPDLGYFSFDYFTADSAWGFYSRARFSFVERCLVFPTGRFSGLFARWANRHPAFYERRLAWIFPAWFLIFKLKAERAA
jgi:hypothetical protein